mgnify:CR=1 FL=1
MSQFDILDEKARDIIQSRISKGMIGPGSDTWGIEETEEIISDYPLQRYFSGIIFPVKTISQTIEEKEDAEAESEGLKDLQEFNEENIDKLKEVEGVLMPLIAKAYQSNAPPQQSETSATSDLD